ncbi:MAG TPA: 3-phosphoglycerate dehydrogenase, partial [Nitrosomonas sp.]|nr:3-phosphoglycerate dehydrogenase [Nitrosomonas sp.]
MAKKAQQVFKILTLNQISSVGLKQFPADQYLIGHDLVDPDVILVRSHNMLDMDIPKHVIAIGRAGAGT